MLSDSSVCPLGVQGKGPSCFPVDKGKRHLWTGRATCTDGRSQCTLLPAGHSPSPCPKAAVERKGSSWQGSQPVGLQKAPMAESPKCHLDPSQAFRSRCVSKGTLFRSVVITTLCTQHRWLDSTSPEPIVPPVQEADADEPWPQHCCSGHRASGSGEGAGRGRNTAGPV